MKDDISGEKIITKSEAARPKTYSFKNSKDEDENKNKELKKGKIVKRSALKESTLGGYEQCMHHITYASIITRQTSFRNEKYKLFIIKANYNW